MDVYSLYKTLSVLVCVNELIMPLLLLCSALTYHGYNSSNIDSGIVGILLNIPQPPSENLSKKKYNTSTTNNVKN